LRHGVSKSLLILGRREQYIGTGKTNDNTNIKAYRELFAITTKCPFTSQRLNWQFVVCRLYSSEHVENWFISPQFSCKTVHVAKMNSILNGTGQFGSVRRLKDCS